MSRQKYIKQFKKKFGSKFHLSYMFPDTRGMEEAEQFLDQALKEYALEIVGVDEEREGTDYSHELGYLKKDTTQTIPTRNQLRKEQREEIEK